MISVVICTLLEVNAYYTTSISTCRSFIVISLLDSLVLWCYWLSEVVVVVVVQQYFLPKATLSFEYFLRNLRSARFVWLVYAGCCHEQCEQSEFNASQTFTSTHWQLWQDQTVDPWTGSVVNSAVLCLLYNWWCFIADICSVIVHQRFVIVVTSLWHGHVISRAGLVNICWYAVDGEGKSTRVVVRWWWCHLWMKLWMLSKWLYYCMPGDMVSSIKISQSWAAQVCRWKEVSDSTDESLAWM